MNQKVKSILHKIIAVSAYWYYGRPSRKLVVVGITGTKGKSTTSRLAASVLEAGGFKVGLLSTVEFQIGDKRWLNDKKMTMLGKGQIQKMLREMVNSGCTHVVIETSSEGILQYRHYGLNYDVVLFTNLGSEHAERHGGYENLKKDKGKMFSNLINTYKKKINGVSVPKTIIANGDDIEAGYFLSFWSDKKIAYGFEVKSFPNTEVIKAEKIPDKDESFLVNGREYALSIIGAFNTYNGLAALAVGKTFGISEDLISDGLKSVKLVPGRMEFLEQGQPFKFVVDYAHEPMSLNALFISLKKLVTGKVIAIIGSDGGGRDKQKRGKMGLVSAKIADVVIITDVNCYDENPNEIAEMLAAGAREAGKKDGENLFIEIDRKKAIKLAIEKAGPNDVVAVTAKGTEPFIGIAKGEKIVWDDRLISRELLSEVYGKK